MKTLKFVVTVEGLPDHAKDYRVAGDICAASYVQLRAKYPDGQVELGINPEKPARDPRSVLDLAAKLP